MPYRRLPNTDKARAKAMNIALKNQEQEIKLVIPYEFRKNLEDVARNFENKLNFKNTMQQKGILDNKEHLKNGHKLRMYLSHFLQVVNMSIQRGELSKQTRVFYGIEEKDSKLPDFNTEKALLYWGEKIIKGENERILQKGTRIYNPSLALVSIHYEKFIDSYKNCQNQQNVQQRASEKLARYRETADKCIVELWNIIEKHFQNHHSEMFHTICGVWGINYVYRKGERKSIEEQRYVKSISPSLNF